MSSFEWPPKGGSGGGGSGFQNPATEDLDMGAYNIEFAGGNSTWTVFPSGGDDTSAIQAAVTAAATAGGGVVQLFEGTYTITDAITWPVTANNVLLRGVGMGTIVNAEIPLEDPPTNPWAFDLLGEIVLIAMNNTTIGDATITATTAAQAGSFQAGDVVRIEGTDPDSVKFFQEGVVVSADSGTGVITLQSPVSETLTSVSLRRYRTGKNNGIMDLSMFHPGALNGSHAIGLRYQYAPLLKNVYANGEEGSGGAGITIVYCTQAKLLDCVFEDFEVVEHYPTVLDDVNPVGLDLQDNLSLVMQRCIVRNCGLSSVSTGAGIQLGAAHVNCKFVDVVVEDSQKNGISIGSTSQLNNVEFRNVAVNNSNEFGLYAANGHKTKKVLFSEISIFGTNYGSGGSHPGLNLVGPAFSRFNIFKNIQTENCAGEGINVWSQDDFIIQGCTGQTILIYQCENGTIADCAVNHQTGSGLYIWDCDDISVTGGSYCENGGRGILSEASSSNVTISGVVAKNNTGNNLELDATDSTFTITGNDFGGTGVVYSTGTGHKIWNNQDGINRTQTYTPVVTLSAAGTVPQYTTNSGRYEIIGNKCFVDILLDGDGGNEGAGAVQIYVSLPVAVSSSHLADVAINYHVGMALNNTTQYMLTGSVDQASQKIFLRYVNTTNTDTNPFTAALQNNATRTIRLHFWYEIA